MSAERSINSLLAIDSLIQSFDRNPVSPKQSNSNYAVGDVVRINPMRKINTVTCLARVRATNIEDDTLLQLLNTDNDEKKQNTDNNNNIKYIGVEYFNWKQKINNETDLIVDGVINGVKIFDVKKAGYGAFIKETNIIGSAIWTKYKSRKALKLKHFHHETFIKAAKYGSMPVIKHMLQMNSYPNDPSIITSQNKTKGGYSAICQAISCNHYEIVKLLLKNKPRQTNRQSNDCKDDHKYDIDINNNEYILPKLRILKARKNSDVLQSSDKKTIYYNPKLFDKLCKDGNIKMLKILLENDSWPIYYKYSYGLYLAATCGNLQVIKLLLNYLNDASYINLPLFFDKKQRTIIPQTNLNLLNVAISHHRLSIVKYLITEWKYRDVIIKNKCLYYPNKPHILPTLLYTILDCHLHFKERIDFTCDCIELLTKYCDPIDIGLNWVCDKRLSAQKNIIIGDFSTNPYFNTNVLNINRTLCVGTLLAALLYKCKALWVAFRAYDDEKKGLKLGLQRLITVLVQNGMDWNIAKYDVNVKNIIMKYRTYPNWTITDLDVDICDDEDFVKFFRETVSNCIDVFREIWLNAFLNFYKEDKLMANIFKWYVLDYVVPPNDILDGIKYFTIKKIEIKNKQKNKKDDPNYIDWDSDDLDDNNNGDNNQDDC